MQIDPRIWVLLPFLVSTIDALRILVLFPVNAKSHSILGQGVVTHLLKAGHEVVHITSYPRVKKEANLTEIDVGYIGQPPKHLAEKMDQFKIKNLVGKGNIADSTFFLQFLYDYNKRFLEDEKIVKLLSDPKEHYDVVVLEWFFSELVAGIAPLFQCPLVWVATTEAHAHVLRVIDEIPNPAYSVDLFSTSRPPLSFTERVTSLWGIVKKMVLGSLMFEPDQRDIYNNVFPPIAAKRGVTVPPYDEAIYNASLLLINSHPSIGTPFRLPQNAKYIAGYHVDSQPQPLPKELQKLMDESKQGVIYFSMGSNLKSVEMSDEMKKSLLDVFSKLKETVIWKFEEDMEKPLNVHFVKWAPQQSILAHPNCKLFITHGGQLSTTEAIHYGIPVIGVPVLGDQHINMKSVVEKGFGVKLDLAEDLADNLKGALYEVLHNPSYKIKAKEISQIFHDRTMAPGDELVFWIEHVVKTQGALHLRSPALHVPLYQKLFLDLLACIVIALVTLYYLLCFLLKKIRSKKPVKESKKKVK
ncbi:UDP-glucosyltransferase 2 [Manduca sexta]|uniref:UDP-glucuronosyltransferase n=1 Tax=Manduca sexta TaxID=7130 RepID=A0A921ZIH6_MANSE|nr:UDP-glucosyltransferase 2 [Manduca sexta]KAG6458622.1 UDP-glycosyltransferase [Manduca sexta]